MLKQLLGKYGIIPSTVIISIFCVIISILVTATIWIVLRQPNMQVALLTAFICPSLIAPPLFFSYSRLTEELQKSQPHLKLTPYEIFETIEKTKLEPEPKEQIAVIKPHELIEPAVVEEKSAGSEKPSFQETVVISSESYEIFNKINGVMVRILILLLFELPISLPNQVIVDKLNLSPSGTFVRTYPLYAALKPAAAFAVEILQFWGA